ncbi:hypothetical protein TRFO_14140 [Tritrichomonas foetus]|uniref:Uncharacterized protein n=1 Tax=Tritrichomonas foetus TaxID=1144522 RepID=A0A1J4KVX7_9EUKA|nr:hypothetical protein TRFO_14140 [Tritrichomonas foetus]|eukprot:OHT15387.1 hypothetical protein TRFO_14140 [Tritrichomonas foetus]
MNFTYKTQEYLKTLNPNQRLEGTGSEDDDDDLFFEVETALTEFNQCHYDLKEITDKVFAIARYTAFTDGEIVKHPLFFETGTLDHLIEVIQMDSQIVETKVEAIYALSMIADYLIDSDIDMIANSPFMAKVFYIFNEVFPGEEKNDILIQSTSKILNFYISLVRRTENSRNSFLQNVSFENIFYFAQASYQHKQIFARFLNLLSCLCYFQLSEEAAASAVHVIFAFLNHYGVEYWDELIRSLRLICLNSQCPHLVAQKTECYQKLSYAIKAGSRKTTILALKIINIFLDKELDVFHELEFNEICNAILSIDEKTSVTALHLIEVMVEEHSMYTEFLLRNHLLNNIKTIIDDGTVLQKISALQVIYYVAQSNHPNIKNILHNIIRKGMIGSIIELSYMDTFMIDRLVVEILYLLVKIDYDEDIQLHVISQINEDHESLLSELANKYLDYVPDNDSLIFDNSEHSKFDKNENSKFVNKIPEIIDLILERIQQLRNQEFENFHGVQTDSDDVETPYDEEYLQPTF